jgi:hypothetical protein
MIKSNSCVYFIPAHPLFNTNEAPLFGTFDEIYSAHLYLTLILNHKEKINSIVPPVPNIFCFDENDRGYLPEEFSMNKTKNIYLNGSNKSFVRAIYEKYLNQYKYNLLISTNTVGITTEDINRIFDLLSREDETVIIGVTNTNRSAFIGFNSLNPELLYDIDFANPDFEKFLNKLCRFDYFIHVIHGLISVDSVDDFKNLYIELSKKENYRYCSQSIHERFTHLFIEYKELLK